MSVYHSTTETPTAEQGPGLPAGLGWRVGGLAVAAALVGNLIALAVASVADADMMVQPTGAGAPMEINAGLVVATTALTLLAATVLLVLLRHRGTPTWRLLAAIGLGLGVLTIAMPLTVTATTGTRVALASMHLLTGLVWFVLVRHATASAHNSVTGH